MEIDVFISHHTSSSLHIVEGIANQLEACGIRCWYAPRNTEGAYASSISKALNNCKIFLLILNKPASESFHVLNEIDLVCKRLVKGEDVKVIPFHVADDEIGEDAQYYLGRMHWIDAMTPPMYQRIDELTGHIADLLGREVVKTESRPGKTTEKKAYKLVSKMPQAREIFDGRDHLIEQIRDLFASGKRTIFLEGIGGIGKSELAKQYALRYKDEYDHILFLTYESSLEKLICDFSGIIIEDLEEQRADEDEAAFFARKLKVLCTITDEKTLLIVDNFDVDTDEQLKTFLEGNYRVIFTTRNSHAGYPVIKVEAIRDMDVLMNIFEQNFGGPIEEEERPILEEIFQLVEYHTYAIELIAKQMEASFFSAQEMLEVLQQGQLPSSVMETVEGRKDRKTAFEHICSVFNTSKLSEEEMQILRNLSLMGTEGVLANRFKEWSQLSSFETVNQLVRRSWIRKERGQKISLHPLVKEVVHAVLTPTEENCHDFIWKVGEFCYRAWYRRYGENVAVANNIVAILDYFKEPDARECYAFESFAGFLWQVGKFTESIYYIQRVYESCVKTLGTASMDTGFVAKTAGGCFFNSRREKESIPWYKLGLEHMLESGMEESEDMAMSYEKVARCYTWEYEQNFELAEKYFQKALDIRIRLKERLKNGEQPSYCTCYEVYNLNLAEERIGESYMEMGRMYQMEGDYRKALEYAQKQLEIIMVTSPDNKSGIAYDYYDSGVCYYHLGLEVKDIDPEEATKNMNLAKQNLEHALELNMEMRGALAVDTIDNQEYLADTYAALGSYGEASNAYMAVISMTEGLWGKDHPRIERVKAKMNFQ